MSEDTKKTPSVPAAKKGGGIGGALSMTLPALFAGAAAFGGAKIGGGKAAAHSGGHGATPPAAAVAPPGPTLSLEPFLVSLSDAEGRHRVMRMTIAIEFDASTPEDRMTGLVPRVRDAALSYLRGLSFDDATNPQHASDVRTTLLAKVRDAGAAAARRVLVTDLVVQ